MKIGLVLLLASVTGLAACATPLRPTEVTRFHLGAPVARGTVAVEPLAGGAPATSLEFQTYADAVRRELARVGYTPAAPGATAQFLANVGYARASREALQRSPLSIGLGGGSFSGGRRGGVGLGGGLGFPIGGGPREIIVTELFVTIKSRADGTAVWEGRAQAEADPRKPDADPAGQAAELAAALFDGFPGESGQTIEVR